MAVPSPLEYAIQLEVDGQAFYSKAAGRTENPLGRKMFESLAADERRHEQVLRGLAQKMKVSLEGPLPKQRIATLFSQLGADLKSNLGANPDDNAVIEQAIKMEEASVKLYQEQAQAASGVGKKSVYERLVQEERQHVDVLRSTLMYLNDTGLWFLWDEQSLLDGG